MKLEVVAEGVETIEQLEMLRELNCDFAQGYFFSAPMPKEDYIRLLSRERIAAPTVSNVVDIGEYAG